MITDMGEFRPIGFLGFRLKIIYRSKRNELDEI